MLVMFLFVVGVGARNATVGVAVWPPMLVLVSPLMKDWTLKLYIFLFSLILQLFLLMYALYRAEQWNKEILFF